MSRVAPLASPTLPRLSSPMLAGPSQPPVVKLTTQAPKYPGFGGLQPSTFVEPQAPWMRNPLQPPTPDLLGAVPSIDKPVGPLMILDKPYWPITIDQLQPGDIGFDFRAINRSKRQKIIYFGESIQNLYRQNRRGSPDILHSFLILQPYPSLGLVRAVDAATGAPPYGVMLTDLDYGEFQTKEAFHVFYRFKDPRLRQRIADIAFNWAQEFEPNFSSWHAVRSVWTSSRLTPEVQANLLHLSKTSDDTAPMKGIDGQSYPVMCSEFVGTVGAAAAMSLYVDDHPGTHLGDPQTLQAVLNGPAGEVFNVNPGSVSPSALASRLARDAAVEPVGYIYAFA